MIKFVSKLSPKRQRSIAYSIACNFFFCSSYNDGGKER